MSLSMFWMQLVNNVKYQKIVSIYIMRMLMFLWINFLIFIKYLFFKDQKFFILRTIKILDDKKN